MCLIGKKTDNNHFWWLYILMSCLFVWFDSLHPTNNLSVIKGRVFLGWTSTKLGLMFLFNDTTQWHGWGSNLRPLRFESSTLPLNHCASLFLCLPPYNSNCRYFEIKSVVPRTLNLQDSTLCSFENSVDPDQLASSCVNPNQLASKLLRMISALPVSYMLITRMVSIIFFIKNWAEVHKII